MITITTFISWFVILMVWSLVGWFVAKAQARQHREVMSILRQLRGQLKEIDGVIEQKLEKSP